MKPMIEVQNLRKEYEFYRKAPGLLSSLRSLLQREKLVTRAVNDISFTIQEGELVGFLGPNGAGKTTTLKMLSGILHPTAGVATVLGHTPWKREAAYQKQFALVMGQKNQLWWDLPAQESFLLNKEIYDVPNDVYQQTIEELSSLLEIKDLLDIPVRKLSLGQRMKCELVAALLHRPKVLFLDEPTIGLDVVSQQNIREFILSYNRKSKTTILLTSHYMDDIEQLCRRVIIINKGEIGYDGSLDELVRQYIDHKVLTVTFEKPVDKKDLSSYGDVIRFDPQHAVVHVPRAEAKNRAARLLSSELPVDDILIDEEGIDDVIRKVFQSSP
jgi:ABC-2 type transport system ATP-binding protein